MQPTTVTTGLARLSYLAAFEPSSIKGSKLMYRCTPLIPKTDKETLARVDAAIKAAIEEGKKKFWTTGKLPKDFKMPLRDGDEEQATEDVEGKGPEYKGMKFFNASNKDKPGLVDTKKQPIFEEEKLYSGAWGLVNVTFYPFHSNGSDGIAVSLNHIMKVKDDDKFASRVSLDAAFDGVDASKYDLLD